MPRIISTATILAEGFGRKNPQNTIDLYIKQGSDISEQFVWYVAGTPLDFTAHSGVTARLPIVVAGRGDVLGLTTTNSPYGGITLAAAGLITIAITKAASQALRASNCASRAVEALYIDWPDSTSTCLFSGTAFITPGSPF